MALITHQTQGSYATFASRPSLLTKSVKPKPIYLVTLPSVGRAGRCASLKHISCLRARWINGPKGKPFKVSAFKGNVHNDESSRSSSGSQFPKNSVKLSYVQNGGKEIITESPEMQNVPLSCNSEERDGMISGSPAIRNLFKKWLMILRTQSLSPSTNGLFGEQPPEREISETSNGSQKREAGNILKAAWRYFLGLDAMIKLPLLILGIQDQSGLQFDVRVNQKIVEEEVARKKEEYLNDLEIMQISKLYEMAKVEFNIEVVTGPSQKAVALQAVKNLQATWVILDRHMKKDKKYFLDNLSCGISRLKRDNNIEQLRGPEGTGKNKLTTKTSKMRVCNVTYDEMIPGSPESADDDLFSLDIFSSKYTSTKTSSIEEQGADSDEESPQDNHQKKNLLSKSSSSEHLILMATASSSSLASTEVSSSSFNEANYFPLHIQEEENETITTLITAGEWPPNTASDSKNMGQTDSHEMRKQEHEQKPHSSPDNWVAGQKSGETFENSICSVCKNRRPKIGLKRDFTYAELQAATDGFSDKNFLSEGGFGAVFKGKLRNGMQIAVKQHKNASTQGEKEFKSEVQVLSKARHKNVVMLLGSCSEGSQRLLVYEYVCNGSLDQHLSKHRRRPLSWEERLRIALGAARGLQYLHENNIIHRDMRPNNILVTHDHEPLLGDFGLARTQHEGSDHSSENRVVGTFGYLAPEYAEIGKVSTKTDVFSFGVVLLELITGRRTTDKTPGERSLVGWARPLLKQKKYPDLIDLRIVDAHDVLQLFWMVRVAEKCICKDPEKRLSMQKVVSALQDIMDGKTVCGIEDFPSKPDSIGSVQDSTGSQSDEGTTEQESYSADSLSFNNTSQGSKILSSASSTLTTSSRRSTTSSSSERSSSSYEKRYKKKRVNSRSKFQVHKGESLH